MDDRRLSIRGGLQFGGGSPNTIAPLLGEWKALHEQKQAASLPPIPEPVEAVLRQVWGRGLAGSAGAAHGRARGPRPCPPGAGECSAHEQTRTALHEAQAVVSERAERLAAQDDEIKMLHHQLENYASQEQSLKSERDQVCRELEAQGRCLERTRQRLAETEEAFNALRIEKATLTERAGHVEEISALITALKDLKGKSVG